MASSRFQDFILKIAQLTADKFQSLRQRTHSWFLSQALVVRQATLSEQPKTDEKDVEKTFMELGERDQFNIGKMVLFNYDPKWKNSPKLPYYDVFPLVFPIEFYNDGFLGINMHYLPPVQRAILMDALYNNLIDPTGEDPQDRLRISYGILKGGITKYKNFWPCVKRYLYSHVRSQWSVIPLERWEMVLMLPLASWRKASEAHVWNESLRIIRNK